MGEHEEEMTEPGSSRHVTLVAEVGQCRGDADYAHRIVDYLAKFRSETVDVKMKIQLLRPDDLAARSAGRYDYTGGDEWGQRDLFHRLDARFWEEVVDHARQVGVDVFPSVFSPADVDMADRLGISRWLKVASGDMVYRDLVSYAAKAASERLVVSTGAADESEVRWMLGWLPWREVPTTLLACHLRYPSQRWEAHLGRMAALRELIADRDISVGYSNHVHGDAGGVDVAAWAVAFGATIVESHFTMSRGRGDDTFALTPVQFTRLWDQVHRLQQAWGRVKVVPTIRERPARLGARRVAIATRTLTEGHVISEGDVAWQRGYGGGDPANLFWVGSPRSPIGAVVQRRIPIGSPIRSSSLIGRKEDEDE